LPLASGSPTVPASRAPPANAMASSNTSSGGCSGGDRAADLTPSRGGRDISQPNPAMSHDKLRWRGAPWWPAALPLVRRTVPHRRVTVPVPQAADRPPRSSRRGRLREVRAPADQPAPAPRNRLLAALPPEDLGIRSSPRRLHSAGSLVDALADSVRKDVQLSPGWKTFVLPFEHHHGWCLKPAGFGSGRNTLYYLMIAVRYWLHSREIPTNRLSPDTEQW
jgi:hypothetical protein